MTEGGLPGPAPCREDPQLQPALHNPYHHNLVNKLICV